MEFRVLGPLEVWDGVPVAIAGRKPRALLAFLLLEANRVQSAGRLIEALWDGSPPASARDLLSLYVHQLRKVLDGRPGAPRLLTRAPGYVIEVEPGQVDLFRFEVAAKRAREALARGDHQAAAEGLRGALALWRGPALADVESRLVRDVEAPRVEELRLAAQEDRIEADLALGGHAELVGELEGLVAEHPGRERLWLLLMRALRRAGRRGEATAAYQRAWHAIRQAFGIEPGPALRELHRAILDEDGGQAESVVPSQLPPDIADFTGRQSELALLAELLESAATGPVVVLTGPAGVGKTALAIRGARLLRSRFSDGILHVDLRSGDAPDAAAVLGELLVALGVNRHAIPPTADERMRLYRSHVAERRVLVVLDNAAREAQVRPLLPGGARTATIVTSRGRLAGLEAAQALEVGVLDRAESVALLRRIVGPVRVAEEPEAAHAIADLCGDLPLAIRIAGARLAARGHWRLGELAAWLSDERRRLDELVAGDLQVRASFALSYREQDELGRRAFRLLGLTAAPDVTVRAAAALLDLPQRAADAVLDRLAESQLLAVAGRDEADQVRYRFHDLLQAFARERAAEEHAEPDRLAAIERLVETSVGALAVAVEAAGWLEGEFVGAQRAIGEGVRRPEPEQVELIRRDPLVWFRCERASLLAAIELAWRHRVWALTWKLAVLAGPWLRRDVQWSDAERALRLGVAAAERCGDAAGQAAALDHLGRVLQDESRWSGAIDHLRRAALLCERAGDPLGAASATARLAMVYRDATRLDEARVEFERCLAVFRAHGDGVQQVHVLRGLGLVERDSGRLRAAAERFTECLRLAEELRIEERVYVDRDLGNLYRELGQPAEARDCLERCLAFFRQAGNAVWEAATLRSLGETYRDLGRHRDALDALEASLATFERLGDTHWQGYILVNLGETFVEMERLADAETALVRAEGALAGFGDRRAEAHLQRCRGAVCRRQGRIAEAARCYEEAATVFAELGLWLWEGRSLIDLGEAIADAGDRRAALATWRRALAVLRQVDAADAEALAGRLSAAHGDL